MFAGVGLSALMGASYVGTPDHRPASSCRCPAWRASRWWAPRCSRTTRSCTPRCRSRLLMCWALFSTRWGLAVRAVGENPVAAFAAGRNPRVLQYQALLLAGVLGGIAGADLSIGVARDVGGMDDRGARLHRGRAGDLRALAAAARHRRRRALRRRHLAAAAAADARDPDLAVPSRHAAVRAEPRRPGRVGRRRRRRAAPASLGRVFQGSQ